MTDQNGPAASVEPLRVLGIVGSLRAGSYNRRLLEAARALAPADVQIEVADLAEVPLYNSDPGVLQNAIDWASRPGMKSPLAGKPVAIMSASPGALGGARAAQQLKLV